MLLQWYDYAIIALSLLVTLLLGLWFSRRWSRSEDFFLAGRNVTWPFIGFSLFATNISSEHFVGLAAGGHKLGLVQGGYEWIASYCILMLALVFAPQYLKHRVFTIPEYFEKRYGIEVRMSLTVYFLIMIVLTKTAVAVFAGSIVIRDLTGWGLTEIMWGIGIFTAIYTMAGGLAAVIYTDTLQAVILIAGSTVLTWVTLGEVGGWSGLVEKLEATGRLGHLSMVRPPTDPGLPFSGFLLGNFLIGGLFYWCMDQVNVQRVLGARSLNHGRGGAVFAGFLKIIPVFILVLPGVAGAVLYPTIHPNDTYSTLLRDLMPVGIRGFVIAALLAALMSSLSSTFNSGSTLVARDLVVRFRPQTTMAVQIAVGHLALIAVMVSGILCAPLVGLWPTLWDYLQEVTGYLSVPFAVAGLLGVLSRRVNRSGAMAGVAAGVLAGAFLFADSYSFFAGDPVTGSVTRTARFFTSPYMASFLHRIFIAGVISAATMILVSALGPPPREEVTRGDFWLFSRSPESEGPRPPLYADYRLWAAILFVVVTGLWVVFR